MTLDRPTRLKAISPNLLLRIFDYRALTKAKFNFGTTSLNRLSYWIYWRASRNKNANTYVIEIPT
jgi:hypothetical protein